MALTDNGFRSALRPNSATANGETEYSKIHIIEVQHAITQYRNTLHKIQNTEIQKYVVQWVQVSFEAQYCDSKQ